METGRLQIRLMADSDETSFISGISDRLLRNAYGFPPDMDGTVSQQVFRQFCKLENAYALIDKATGMMVGFLLDVNSELPVKSGVPDKGRTLAFAVFPPFQRSGYMQEALKAYIAFLFLETETEYIHCGHFPENGACRKLLDKLAFQEYTSHRVANRVIMDKILFRQPPVSRREGGSACCV